MKINMNISIVYKCFTCPRAEPSYMGKRVVVDNVVYFFCFPCIENILAATVVESRHRDEHTERLQERLQRANDMVHDKGIMYDILNNPHFKPKGTI